MHQNGAARRPVSICSIPMSSSVPTATVTTPIPTPTKQLQSDSLSLCEKNTPARYLNNKTTESLCDTDDSDDSQLTDSQDSHTAVATLTYSTTSSIQAPQQQVTGRHSKNPSSSSTVYNPVSTATTTTTATTSTSRVRKLAPKRRKKRGTHVVDADREWQILEGLRCDQRFETKPEKFEGIMMKRRKWPLKGWHKRLFKLEQGTLIYAKSAADLNKGRFHGTIDIGLSVLTFKRRGCRIDIDADDLIYHLKVKSRQMFDMWLSQLRQHRLYRQDDLQYRNITTPTQRAQLNSSISDTINKEVRAVISPSVSLNDLSKLSDILVALEADIEKLDEYTEASSITSEKFLQTLDEVSTAAAPSTGSKHQFRLQLKRNGLMKSARKHRKPINRLSVPADSSMNHGAGVHLSSSNPNLVSFNHDWPQSTCERLENTEPICNGERKLRYSFLSKAKEVHETLIALVDRMNDESDRFKHVHDMQTRTLTNTTGQVQILHLLAEAQKRNEEYELRLSRIHADSSPSHHITSNELMASAVAAAAAGDGVGVSGVVSGAGVMGSTSRTMDSNSMQQEFFDAEEYLTTSGESTEQSEDEDDVEEEEEEAASSEISEDAENTVSQSTDTAICNMQTGRRSRLPAPKCEAGGVSLWKLLCRNIGKDLSKISMPVTLNEPLNTLQRLCEELEYSELLDKASETEDAYQRMVLIAAFSVSAYGATQTRAGQKPFNPLLAETYECIREDKGWRFISEQVSHHPPISSCHCESKNFVFWQDMRVRSKFWGKSMEFQPIGMVHIELPKYNEHYTFNKVTTCVHNIYGDLRWVDHYGEVVITNKTTGITCHLTYAKSSDRDHQIYGTVLTPQGETQNTLFGKWSEGLYCGKAPSAKCIWRPGSMPAESPIYYGFSRFAIELNEIDPDQVARYAPTDSRFRPDQRLLENGDIQGAETAKLELERSQRARRKIREDKGDAHKPVWFSDPNRDDINKSSYLGTYWQRRKDASGFTKITLPTLW